MQAFIYVSNLGKAMERAGAVWLGMARVLYVEKDRKMKTIGRMKEVDTVTIGDQEINGDGEQVGIADLTRANFDVAVDIGPSSSTQKSKIVKMFSELAQTSLDPEMQMVAQSMAIANMDGEGMGDLQEWNRKRLLKAGIGEPTDKDKEETAAAQENQQPNAQDQFLQSESAKADALAQKAQADTVKSMADASKSEAQTQEILAGIPRDDRQQAIEAAEKLDNQVQRQTVQPINGARNGTPPGQIG
jgi:hypothetical protein